MYQFSKKARKQHFGPVSLTTTLVLQAYLSCCSALHILANFASKLCPTIITIGFLKSYVSLTYFSKNRDTVRINVKNSPLRKPHQKR